MNPPNLLLIFLPTAKICLVGIKSYSNLLKLISRNIKYNFPTVQCSLKSAWFCVPLVWKLHNRSHVLKNPLIYQTTYTHYFLQKNTHISQQTDDYWKSKHQCFSYKLYIKKICQINVLWWSECVSYFISFTMLYD